jgi:hypothetical protein
MARIMPMTRKCFNDILLISTLVFDDFNGILYRENINKECVNNEVLSLLRRYPFGRRRFFLRRVRKPHTWRIPDSADGTGFGSRSGSETKPAGTERQLEKKEIAS